jgi:amidase
MDKERSLGKIRGPMHGIPVMLKANINTDDKMHTTAGSMALKDNYAPYDAKIVKNLRASGVVILGKTNLTEFANFMTKNMRNGYSSLGGEVLCPYDRNADPCGSSTGSAVSVAVGLCPAAIGTETSGSIICPSWTNGIVGIKPTRELIPGEGIIPISGTLDTAGPMARSVADAAALLGAMTGKGDSFSKGLGSATLKGKRIGLNKFNLGDIGTDKAAVYEKITGIMEASGAELVELPGMDHNVNLKYFLYYEFKNNMNHYLSTLNSGFGIKTMDDIIDFNKANKKKALKYDQFYLLQAKYFSSGRCMEADYLKALKAREDQIKELESLFRENDLDSILHANIYNNLAAFTGCPSITIPTGLDSKGMPMGMQMISWKFNDRTLIETAYALEKALDIQLVPPGF